MAFDYPLRRKTPLAVQRNQGYQVREERRKPVLPTPWIYVGDWIANDDPGNDPPVTTWQSPPWLNSWTWVDPFYVGFRHGLDGETEFTGVVDATSGVSGTTAFILPGPYWPVKEHSFITDLDLGGGEFNAARIVTTLAGHVVVYYPLTA